MAMPEAPSPTRRLNVINCPVVDYWLLVTRVLRNMRALVRQAKLPVKWMKLIQWWLLHRVPIDVLITPEIEAAACARFKIPPAAWEEAKKRFPNLLPKVNQKRLRRMEYFLETGELPPAGWTPPDPKNRSTQNLPPYASFWKH